MPAEHFVDTNVLVKVIRTLCLYAGPKQPGLSRGAVVPKSVAEAVEFLAPLDALLADWPTGFRAHVAQRIAAGRQDARTLTRFSPRTSVTSPTRKPIFCFSRRSVEVCFT